MTTTTANRPATDMAAATDRAKLDAALHTLRRVRLYAAVMEHSPNDDVRAVARQVRAYANPLADADPEPGTWEYRVDVRFSGDPDNAWVETGRTTDHAEALEWVDRWPFGASESRIVSRLVTEWETVEGGRA